MNSIKQKIFFVFTAFLTLSINAQNTDSNTCDFKVNEAKILLTGSDVILKNETKAIEILSQCANDGNPEALYIIGMLYKNGHIFEKDTKKAFSYIEKSALQNNPKATCELGILYKDGIGCKLNFNTAIDWFRKAYDLGNHKASYSLGYLYFKGFGNIDQDYAKAIEWFKKSEYPMAKHFLGICNYFGYGLPVDKDKAFELFLNNPKALKSEILATFLDIDSDELNTNNTLIDKELSTERLNEIVSITADNENEKKYPQIIDKNQLLGKWTGKLVELDWSGSMILRNLNSSLIFNSNEITNDLNYQLIVNDKTTHNDGILLDNNFYLNKSEIDLPKVYQDSETKFNLNYNILSINDIEIKEINKIRYLVANIETKITDWNEPGPPMLLVLGNTKALTDNGQEIDLNLIEALTKLKDDSFIKLYPNPFKNDLLIQYDLSEDSLTSVEVYSFSGQFTQTIVTNEQQKAGKHIYHVDGSTYPQQGLYVVRVTSNDILHTKLIIKE
ncbi:T9SS type A sorting domain-containing protein [Aquimarina agarilytica]|uniref:T9SS type A sorting domain-containing protein n=1 Tax=Aquimarina agarilytica TaxID=1087449 RepID=UPI000288AE46|nr:T9SS type A sorting domain-containing protein [Aquimarina agarilytica]